MHKNCRRCEHREEFKSNVSATILHLCMAEPVEEGNDSSIVSWLDVVAFDSEYCMSFKEKDK